MRRKIIKVKKYLTRNLYFFKGANLYSDEKSSFNGEVIWFGEFSIESLLCILLPILIKLFSVPNSLIIDVKKIFVIMGALMALKTFNTFIIIGVLRSGGDTKYALFLEMGCMWIVSLPLTFFAAYKGLPIYILVGITYTEEIVKFIFGVPRALSKKWANNIVKDI